MPKEDILPRSKDFFDIFLIYNIVFQRKTSRKDLVNINHVLDKCFKMKNMNLELLKELDSEQQRSFHRDAFEEQVLQTLPADSFFKDVTYDQTFSDTLELLDKLLSV